MKGPGLLDLQVDDTGIVSDRFAIVRQVHIRFPHAIQGSLFAASIFATALYRK